MLRMQWVILRFAVNDFVVGCQCLPVVGPPALRAVSEVAAWGICVRLGLISPQRAQMGSAVGWPRHHPGAACGVSLVLEASLEQTVL